MRFIVLIHTVPLLQKIFHENSLITLFSRNFCKKMARINNFCIFDTLSWQHCVYNRQNHDPKSGLLSSDVQKLPRRRVVDLQHHRGHQQRHAERASDAQRTMTILTRKIEMMMKIFSKNKLIPKLPTHRSFYVKSIWWRKLNVCKLASLSLSEGVKY